MRLRDPLHLRGSRSSGATCRAASPATPALRFPDTNTQTMTPPSRRQFLQLSALAMASAATPWAGLQARALPSPGFPPLPAHRPTGQEALDRLLQGNARFVAGKGSAACRTPEDFAKVAQGQAPFAAIIACADSRTAPEIIFDQGVGQLFTVRAAGNVVAGSGPVMKGSIEYAVAELGVSLILVLGHSECGAMKAAIEFRHEQNKPAGAIDDLLELIYPAVDQTVAQDGKLSGKALQKQVTYNNVNNGVQRLRGLDPIIAPAVRSGALMVAGAVHDLATGTVTVWPKLA